MLPFLILAAALQAPTPPQTPTAVPPPIVERLEGERARIDGTIVDLSKHELSVSCRVTTATVLEFLASARGSHKDYETALACDTSAEAFKAALLLLGLEEKGAVVPRYKFDAVPPAGAPLELWIEWKSADGQAKRERAEQVVVNRETGKLLAAGPWVFTGSLSLADGRFLAGVEKILVGFMHTPEGILDNPQPLNGAYGVHAINPALGLKPEMAVTLRAHALPTQP